MDGGFVLIVLLIVIGSIVYSMHQSKKADEAWAIAARTLGMLHDPGGLFRERKLSGRIEGYHVLVETVTRGSGKNASKYTRYHVSFPRPLKLGLRLGKQGMFHGVAMAFGAQDVQTGDPSFDSMVVVKGEDPASVIRFLTESRRGRIRQAMGDFDELAIRDTGVETESSGLESSPQILVRNIRRLAEFARFLTDGVAADGPVAAQAADMRIPRPSSGHIPPPLPQAAAVPQSAPPPLPVPVPRPQPAAAVHKPAAHRPAPEPKRPVNPAPSVPAPPADEPDHGPAIPASDVGAALFSSTRGTADIERRFAAEYAGREVSVDGLLRNAKSTGFDFVLGSGPYLKATVDVPLSAGGTSGRNTFQVIARLPEGTACPAIGGSMAFRGRLVKADGLMRQLYVRVG